MGGKGITRGDGVAKQLLSALQPGQSLPGVLDFGLAGVGVLPEVEEFVVLL
jgi:hypothetical protein